MKSIVITFDAEGGTTVEANGFKGKTCETETAKFIAALGLPVSTKKKPDYHMEDKIKQGN